MDRCLEKSRKIKFSPFADHESIVVLDVIPVEKMNTITDRLYGGKLRNEGCCRYLKCCMERR
jgi:hypothetical protein